MPTLRSLTLAGFAAAALASPALAQPAQVAVEIWSFGFAPNPIRLAAGRPVTLTFVNRSGSSHDFSARGFFRHAQVVAGAAPDGEIDLQPHGSASITLVPAAGTWHAHCSHFLHKQMGMSAAIVVQ